MRFGDAFSPRFRASHRAAVRLGLSASIAIALAGCGGEPRFYNGRCLQRATGFIFDAEYDRSMGGYWRGDDINGIEFAVTAKNSRDWICRKGGTNGKA